MAGVPDASELAVHGAERAVDDGPAAAGHAAGVVAVIGHGLVFADAALEAVVEAVVGRGAGRQQRQHRHHRHRHGGRSNR